MFLQQKDKLHTTIFIRNGMELILINAYLSFIHLPA